MIVMLKGDDRMELKDIIIGKVFYELSPDASWHEFSKNDPRVCFRVRYGRFKIIKINDKTYRAETLKSIGCGYSELRNNNYLDGQFKNQKEMVNRVLKITPEIIKDIEEGQKKYNKEFSWEWFFLKGKKEFFSRLLQSAKKGLQENDLEKINIEMEKIENEVQEIMKRIRGTDKA